MLTGSIGIVIGRFLLVDLALLSLQLLDNSKMSAALQFRNQRTSSFPDCHEAINLDDDKPL